MRLVEPGTSSATESAIRQTLSDGYPINAGFKPIGRPMIFYNPTT